MNHEKTYQAQITALSHDGRGIAHCNGKATFIDNALPGETVEFKYRRRHSRFDEGYSINILTAANSRATPQCSSYGICGGCSLQHLNSAAQISEKQKILENQLQHIGKVKPKHWLEPLCGPVWGYRHKARLGVRFVEKKSQLLIGFREKNNSQLITDMQRCEILHPHVGHAIELLKSMINQLENKRHIPQIEVAIGDATTALVIRHLQALSDSDIACLTQFAAQHNYHIYLQPNKMDSIHRLWPSTAPELLSYALSDFDLQLQFKPSDFTQINPYINRLMIKQALDLLALQPDDSVLDLFCGLGNFTLPIAKKCQQVLGIEGDKIMVQRAVHNAQHNHITNAKFICADLFTQPAISAWPMQQFTKIVLDPPRSGAIEIIPHLKQFAAQRIVYVSCNPATLARDAGEIVHKLNYRLSAVSVIDQFPHTSHVEAMALFEVGRS